MYLAIFAACITLFALIGMVAYFFAIAAKKPIDEQHPASKPDHLENRPSQRKSA